MPYKTKRNLFAVRHLSLTNTCSRCRACEAAMVRATLVAGPPAAV